MLTVLTTYGTVGFIWNKQLKKMLSYSTLSVNDDTMANQMKLNLS